MHYIIIFQSTPHEKAHDAQRRHDRDSLAEWAGPGVFVAASICSVLIQEEGVCAAGYFFLPYEDLFP